MLLATLEKPVLAMEREARFNLKSFLIKCVNHEGANKKPLHTQGLLTTCRPPPHISHHILAYPNISYHIPSFWSTGCNKTTKSLKCARNCWKSRQKLSRNLAGPPQSDPRSPQPNKHLKSYPQNCKSSPKVCQRWPQGSQKTPERFQIVCKKQFKKHPKTSPKPNPELETPFFSECLWNKTPAMLLEPTKKTVKRVSI